jgi:hypothetical protein
MNNKMKLIVLGWILVVMGVLGFLDAFPLGQGPIWYQIIKVIVGLYLAFATKEEKTQ